MAHMIEDNKMFSVELEPWHGLGVVLDAPPTSAEAIAAAGLDWNVDKKQLFTAQAVEGMYNSFEIIPDRYALMRDEDNKVLGLVSANYEVVQNRDAFQFFDPLIQEGIASYETAGCMTNGKTWILARIHGDMHVGGDEVRKYLLLVNGHDGQSSVLVQPTPVRVVCNNTLQASLKAGCVFKHSHRTGAGERIIETRNEILATVRRFDALEATFEMAQRTTLGNEDIDRFIERCLDMDLAAIEERGDEDAKIPRAVQNRLAARSKILELHENGRGAGPDTRGTAWGVYNAAVEFADHNMGQRAKDRVNYQIFGGGAEFKARAMDALDLALVEA